LKYFTKAWYELCQKTSFHLSLTEDKKAETFSEAYFQQVYHDEWRKWLALQEEVHALLSARNVVRKPFDREEAAKEFRDRYVHYREFYESALPEWILRQIADIRVFAMHKAARNVIDAVARYCEENERMVNSTVENYRKYIEEAKSAIGEEIVKRFSFHDCRIAEAVSDGDALRLRFDPSGGFTDITEVELKDFRLIRQDGALEKSTWLYEEIYKENDRFELHALLQSPAEGLVDFIASAKAIVFKVINSTFGATKPRL